MKKGALFEAQIVSWLRENGFPLAERRVMGGQNDRGDVSGVPYTVLELKNQAKMALSGWVEEAKTEGANDGAKWWATVHKRKGKGDPAEQYVTLTADVFVDLLQWAMKGLESA